MTIYQAGFSSPVFKALFQDFGDWLGAEVGSHKAAITVARYLSFLRDIEKQWGGIPPYKDLVDAFGAEGLRRVRLPMRWLQARHGLIVDDDAREHSSEVRRIAELLESIPSTSTRAPVLKAYHDELTLRFIRGRTTLRSVRLALRPAVGLAGTGADKVPISQSDVDAFLKSAPGQAAAVTGFVNFINQTADSALTVNVVAGAAIKRRRHALEAEIVAMMHTDDRPEGISRRWVSLALAYFHGLPKKAAKSLKCGQITPGANGGLDVLYNEQVYWIPLSPNSAAR